MIYFKELVICFAACLLFPRAADACRLVEVIGCTNFEETKKPFNDFLKISDFDVTCRKISSALDCALNPDYIGECEEKEKAKFKSKKALTQAICNDFTYAYQQAAPCFNTADVHDAVSDCLGELDTDDCITYEDLGLCIQEEAEKFQECGKSDIALLEYLAVEFTRPVATANGCSMDTIETDDIATEPTTTTATTTTTTVTSTVTSTSSTTTGNTTGTTAMRTTTMGGNNTTEDPGSGSSNLDAGVRLLSVAFLVALTGRNYMSFW